MAFNFINEKLELQSKKMRYRQRVCLQPKVDGNSPIINVDGKSYINFSSNDYLGLNNHPKINQAMQEGIDRFGLCASSSNLVTGFHYAHQALEQTICEWLNKPNCLLFSSGFSANTALFSALGQKDCYFWLDKLSHASMIDGALNSKATVKRFPHNNVQQLSTLLDKSIAASQYSSDNNNQRSDLIASEGIFSMDGNQAALKPLEKLAQQYNAWLYLDDAHSIGVIGEQGQGSNSIIKTDIIMATFGKAIATNGAFLACDDDLYEYMVNFSRHYIYSTAISPALAWATKASIELVQVEQWRRDKITELTEVFIDLLAPEVNIIKSDSSIQALIVGDELTALTISEEIKKAGFWVTAIRPPTVAINQSRLRVTICSSHNNKDIIGLANIINKVFD